MTTEISSETVKQYGIEAGAEVAGIAKAERYVRIAQECRPVAMSKPM